MEIALQELDEMDISRGRINSIDSEKYTSIQDILSKIGYDNVSNRIKEFLDNNDLDKIDDIDLYRLKLDISKGLRIGSVYERKLKNIDKLEIPGFENGIYTGNDYKEIDNNKNNITPEKIVDTFKCGMKFISKSLGNKFWILLSSGSTFIRKSKFKKVPGDIDIAMRKKDFDNILDNDIFKEGEYGGKGNDNGYIIKNIKYTPVYDYHEYVTDDLVERKRLQKDGLLRMEFDYFHENGVGVNVEIFPEMPGNGLIQPEHMTKIYEIIKVYDNIRDIYNTLPDKRLTQSYFANLVKELGTDSVYYKNRKPKASIRMNTILIFLNQNGITNIDQVINGSQHFIQEYLKYGRNLELGDEGFKGYLEGIEEAAKEAKEYMLNMKDIFSSWKDEKEGIKLKKLPIFSEFTNDTNNLRKELEEISNNFKELFGNTFFEELQIKDKEGKIDYIKRLGSAEDNLILNLSSKNNKQKKEYNTTYDEISTKLKNAKKKINSLRELNMLNPENIAYFSEIFIIEENYYEPIYRLLRKFKKFNI